jgi:ABC-2 type transport system permease protein
MENVALNTPAVVTRHDSVADALADLSAGLKLWELWTALGWHEIRQRYRRSIVGPFWLTISMILMIAALAYLYGGVFGQNIQTYLPFVATGMIVFTLISQIATDSSMTFIGASTRILQLRAPLSLYVFQMLWRNLLIFGHNISIYLLLLIFFPVPIGWNLPLAVVGLFLVLLWGLWVGLVLGALSARFRDVPPIVASVMQVAFFMTPIFWTPGSLPNRELFVQLNPFYYFLDIVRMPLLGETPPMFMWVVVIGINLVSGIVAILFFARYRARIAFWV